MPELRELSRISTKQIKEACNNLHVSERFIAECVGMRPAGISYYRSREQDIPEKYQKRILNTFHALRLMKEGYTMQAVTSGNSKDPNQDIIEVIDILRHNADFIQNNIIRRVMTDYLDQLEEVLS